MAKKVAKSNSGSAETGPAEAMPKTKSSSPAHVKKHVKAKVAAAAAAVEGFVQTLVESYETPDASSEVSSNVQPEAEPETVAVAAAPVLAQPEISHEAVAKLAFCYYMDRGGNGGSQADDWFRALETLRAQAAK